MELKKIQIIKQNNDHFELELNNKIFQVKIIKFVMAENMALIQVNGQPYKIFAKKDVSLGHFKNKKLAIQGNTKNCMAEKLVIQSPIAGRITKILVKNGEYVSQNQAILSIESMKMENEIRASFAAFIKSILISEGNLVQQNQILVVLEKEGDCDAGKFT